MSEPIDPECFSFDGLDEIERAIEALPEPGYLVLFDRTDRYRDERVARFEFGDGANPDAQFGQEQPSVGTWLRQACVRATFGDAMHRFRVRVYAAKGQSLYSAQFLCRCDTVNEPSGLVLGDAPGAAGLEPGVARGMGALGDYYARFGQIVISTVGQLTAVNNAMVLQMGRQAEADRARFDSVMSKLLEDRISRVDAQAADAAETMAAARRHDLAKSAIDQIGNGVAMYFGGGSPEMLQLRAALERSPELKEALADPLVQAELKDPENLKQIAGALKLGASARAQMKS